MIKINYSIFIFLFVSTWVAAQSTDVVQLYKQNPHYLAYQGKPIIVVGSGEHYGAVINLDFDYKTYLQSSATEGMNTTRLFMGSYVEKQGSFDIKQNTLAARSGRMVLPWKRSNVPGYLLGGNRFDLSQWDEAYFARLNDFMMEASKVGIVVEINLFSSQYGDGWIHSPFNPINNINRTDSIASNRVNTLNNGSILVHQERYVRELVRRLNKFNNFYFEIQNEPWADQADPVRVRNDYGSPTDWRSQMQVVSQLADDWQKEVAHWIVSEEKSLPVKHLISQNISNFDYAITDPDPNVSLFTFHYASTEAIRANWYLNKPICFNETGFAGSADSTYRRQAWRFLLNGGALFNNLDFSYTTNSPSGRDEVGTSPAGGGVTLRKQLKVLHDFVNKVNITELNPDYSVVKASPGAMTWAMSDGKTRWVIYCETWATRTSPLMLNLPPGEYSAEWFDAHSGKFVQQLNLANDKVPMPKGVVDRVVVIKKNKAR